MWREVEGGGGRWIWFGVLPPLQKNPSFPLLKGQTWCCFFGFMTFHEENQQCHGRFYTQAQQRRWSRELNEGEVARFGVCLHPHIQMMSSHFVNPIQTRVNIL